MGWEPVFDLVTVSTRIGSRWSKAYSKDTCYPRLVQNLLCRRADCCLPKIQHGYGHPRRSCTPEGTTNTLMRLESALDNVRRAVWVMPYAVGAGIVSRSSQKLAKIMGVIGVVCRAFSLTVSGKMIQTRCMPPPRTLRTMVRVEAAVQIYKQVKSLTYLGGAIAEALDVSVEIARRTRACWMRIRCIYVSSTTSQK